MRKLLNKFIGSIFVILIVFTCVYMFRYLHDSRTYELTHSRTLPKTPQDYILLDQKIDINSASVSIIEALPGIGKITAENVIRYRDSHGPFKSIDDLDAVKGLGSRTIERIRPYLLEIH